MTIALAGCQFAGKREETKTPTTVAAEAVKSAKEAHREFRAQEGWRKDTYRNEELIKQATSKNSRIEISINEQRGLLLVNDKVAMDFPVATGKPTHPTPVGDFKVIEKKEKHVSNLFGKLYNAEGKLVDSYADTRTMIVPEGGRFTGSDMPYWMRLTGSGVGMHIGQVPIGRPASHGCIRLRRQTATTLYRILSIGSPVTISYGMPALGTGDAKPTPQVAPRPIKIVPRPKHQEPVVQPTEIPEIKTEASETPQTQPAESAEKTEGAGTETNNE